MAVLGSSSCVPASSTPHDGTTARKVRENPVLSENLDLLRVRSQCNSTPAIGRVVNDLPPLTLLRNRALQTILASRATSERQNAVFAMLPTVSM